VIVATATIRPSLEDISWQSVALGKILNLVASITKVLIRDIVIVATATIRSSLEDMTRQSVALGRIFNLAASIATSQYGQEWNASRTVTSCRYLYFHAGLSRVDSTYIHVYSCVNREYVLEMLA